MASNSTVSSVYEFPRPIWVLNDVQGQRFETRIGPIVATVVMPAAVLQNDASLWGPPKLAGLPDSALAAVPGERPPRIDAYPDRAESLNPVWETRYAATVRGGGHATALRAVGLELSEDPAAPTHNDTRGSIGDPNMSSRYSVHGTPEARIADLAGRHIEDWFTRVAQWVSVLTQQDLDHRHQLYDASLIGPGFRHWDGSSWRTTAMTAIVPTVTAIGAVSLRTVLRDVGDHKRPPLEWQLLLQAGHSINRGFFRRAVLDCATAAEICVARLVKTSSSVANKPGDGAGLRSLSDWLAAHEKQSYVKDPNIDNLANLRNSAIHSGIEPTSQQTTDAAICARRIVEAHGQPREHTD